MIGGLVIAIVLVVAALGGMLLSWRVRTKRQSGIALPGVPDEIGPVAAAAHGMYLSTTPADRPLERVVAGGLGFRARATVSVTASGVLLERRGGRPLFIDRDRLGGSGSATWTLDRAVERDGLTVLGWRLGDGDAAMLVESSLRLDPGDRASITAAISTLTAPTRKDPHA